MRNIYQLMDIMNKHPWKWQISRKVCGEFYILSDISKRFELDGNFQCHRSVIHTSNNHFNRTTTTMCYGIPKNCSFTLSFSLFWHFSAYSGRCRGLLLQMTTLTQTHSAGFLWARDRPVAETWTWQYITLKIDKHPCPPRSRTRNPSKRAVANLFLWPRGHWDWHYSFTIWLKKIIPEVF